MVWGYTALTCAEEYLWLPWLCVRVGEELQVCVLSKHQVHSNLLAGVWVPGETVCFPFLSPCQPRGKSNLYPWLREQCRMVTAFLPIDAGHLQRAGSAATAFWAPALGQTYPKPHGESYALTLGEGSSRAVGTGFEPGFALLSPEEFPSDRAAPGPRGAASKQGHVLTPVLKQTPGGEPQLLASQTLLA